jgi:hypothetical protein
LADAPRAHRRELPTHWRALPCGRQALLALARLGKNDTYTELATGFSIGLATVCRYVHEAVEVIQALAATLAQAVRAAARKAYVIPDGTVVPIDGVAMAHDPDAPYFSGKIHGHGVNVQTLGDPAGRLLWASTTVPGATNDIKAARDQDILAALTTVGVTTFADKGYQGAGRSVRVPFTPRRTNPDTGRYLPLSGNQKAVNAACPGCVPPANAPTPS